MSITFQKSVEKIEPVHTPVIANNNIPFQKPAIKAHNDNPAPQRQEHSTGSLLFSAFLGGCDALSTVDAALDTAEAVGEIRAERFQAEAKRQGNVSLDMQKGIGNAFQSGAEGSVLDTTAPKSRYLNFDYGYKRKGPAMGMAA